MSKKYLVHVVYDGEVLKELNAMGMYADKGMIDLRWQAFCETNEERKEAEVAIVKVDNWLMSLRFRGQVDRHQFQSERFYSAFEVNAYLTVLSHFGFDADYNRNFVRKIEPIIAEVLLQAYKVDNEARIAPRAFHGEVMERSTFISKFDDFLMKYGM